MTFEGSHASSHKIRIWTLAVVIPLVLGVIVGVLTGPKVASAPRTSKEAPSSYLTASCLIKKDKPQVAISWQVVEGANKNVLSREEVGSTDRKGVVVELTAPFKTYAYTDTEVLFGKKYVYLIDTGINEGWERVAVDVSQASCLKSNVSSNER